MTRCRICAERLDLPEVVVLVPEDVARLPICDKVECRRKAKWIAETRRQAIREVCQETESWTEERWLDEARRLGLQQDRPLAETEMEVVYQLADLRAAIHRLSRPAENDSDGIAA